MDNLASVSAALAALGYSSSSAPVYAARAAHHAAQLLYEAADGELLVTVLVGQRRRPTSIILYLCDSVQERLQPASWGTVSTAVKMLFYSFHAAFEGAPFAPSSAAGSAATGGESVVGTGTHPAGASRGLAGEALLENFGAAGQGGHDENGADEELEPPPAGGDNVAPATQPRGGSTAAEGAFIEGTGGPPGAPTPPTRRPQEVGGQPPPTAARQAAPQRHALPDVPLMLSLPDMRGHEAADATPAVAPADLTTVTIPAEFCAVTLACLRRHYTTDQKMVRKFCMMLMQCTKTLLGRLPPGSLPSKRSPTYIALTPAAVTTAKIIYWDGGKEPIEIAQPHYGNTGVANVPATLAIILCMAHKRSPLYLWLIDQFDAGVMVESGRRRKAAADHGASGGEGDTRGQPRRRLGTHGGGGNAAHGGARAPVGGLGASAGGGSGGGRAGGVIDRSSGLPAGGAGGARAGADGGQQGAGRCTGAERDGAHLRGSFGGANLPPTAGGGEGAATGLLHPGADEAAVNAPISMSEAADLATRAAASTLSRAEVSSSTGDCALMLPGSVVVACGSCDPTVHTHDGSAVPSGLVSASRLRVVDGRLDCPHPHGTQQSLGSLRGCSLLWSLSSLGYVHYITFLSCTPCVRDVAAAPSLWQPTDHVFLYLLLAQSPCLSLGPPPYILWCHTTRNCFGLAPGATAGCV